MSEPRAPILIVDDRPENLDALEVTLADLGQEIVRSSSGQEALEVLLRREFAVILLDVRMPEMDGFETAEYIRKGRRSLRTPIIFITAGEHRPSQLRRGYAVGAVDYIVKPFDPGVLCSKVRVFLDLYRKGKELARQTEQLARANLDLRQAYKELGVVAYAVAHDLRAPIRAMAGYSQILREDYAGKPLDLQGLEHTHRIENGARQMDALIQALLTYCRVVRSTIELERLDPNEIVRSALERATEGRVDRPEITVAGTMPEVLGHRDFLLQVLVTLISNALKFIPAGNRPRARVGHELRGARVRIWVEDNGVGIAPQHRDRLFKAFERLEPEVYDGMGMGLAVAKAAMERMGGEVGVESDVGKGSRFWVELRPWKEAPRVSPDPVHLASARARETNRLPLPVDPGQIGKAIDRSQEPQEGKART
jgi:two-component system, sensor histidine kinase and response regulator